MKSKPTPFFPFSSILFLLFLIIFPFSASLYSQTITPDKLPYDKICAGGPHPNGIAGQVFNEYQASFKISGFSSSVTFVVELSDTNGSFANPTATTPLAPLAGTPPDTNTDKTLTFAVPTNLKGSNTYQLRVKSSTGKVSTSFTIFNTTSTKSLPVYFKVYNNSFLINNNVSTVSFCSGGSVTLTVYNPTPSDPSSSPANYPQFGYNWYKNDVLIVGQNSNSLMVNTPGIYYAKLDYGPCSDINSRSQDVTVTSSSGSAAVISSSSGNPFCAGSQSTILEVTSGNSYIWKKEGNVIAGAVNQTYTTSLPGVYSCDVDFGGCKSTGSIDLKITGTIVANGVTVAEGGKLPLIQEETLSVSSTTTVANPTYQWYLENNPITDATLSTIDITVAGNYKLNISGCSLSFNVYYSEFNKNNIPKIPNIVIQNGQFDLNKSWIIPDDYSNTNTHVVILSSFGEIVYETNNYDNFNAWPQTTIDFKNFNPVYYYIITPNGQSAKKGSITLLK